MPLQTALHKTCYLLLLFCLPIHILAQCFNAPYGQNPLNTQTITKCDGIYQKLASNCLNGEYSKINISSGNLYSFKSSKSTDYITITNNDGTIAYVAGTALVSWVASFTGVIRFYTHANAACGTDNHKKTRKVSCTIPPCSLPGTISTTAISDTSATVSWVAAFPQPLNGYQYEIRTSGTAGSGAAGLVSSGSTVASITTVTVNRLTPGTLYFVYVRSNCGASVSSYQSGGSFTTTGTAPNPVPAFSHIVVVIGENTSAGSVFGSASAPYINALAAAGAKFTNSFALFHPSQPNYLGLYSGSNQGVTNDNFISTKYTSTNLGKELLNAGKTYVTFSEGLPVAGYDGNSNGLYARKHNPAANWMGTGTNQIPSLTNQPFSAFPVDFNNLPSIAFVVPDLCNDGHDICSPLNNSVLQYDHWVQTRLDAYKQWAIANNSLLVVTYDEDDFTGTNKIATVFYGAHVAVGTYSQTINHYNVLRTLEEANRLTVHTGAAATASVIDYCWSSTLQPIFAGSQADPGKVQSTGNYFSVYPNPANDKINIQSTNMTGNTLANWEIIDQEGVKLSKGIFPVVSKINHFEIPVGYLKKGVYFLRIYNSKQQTMNRFVILR
jgi:hypothetical protein